MKSIFTINLAIMKIWNVRLLKCMPHLLILKVGVSLDHGVSLCFVSLLALHMRWAIFQAKNTIKNSPASSALTLVSHRNQYVCTTNRHLRGCG